VRNSKIPVSLEASHFLAACQLQIKHGNFDKANKQINKSNVSTVIPKHLRTPTLNLEEWLANMETEYAMLKDTDPDTAKTRFLKRASENPLYGANIFNVITKGPKVVMGKTWLVLSTKGAAIWEPMVEAKVNWTWDQLSDGGPSKDGFWVRTGSVLKPEKYTFSGDEAFFIHDIFNAYKESYESAQHQSFF